MKSVVFLKLKQGINELERDFRYKYGDTDLGSYKLEALNQIKVYIEGYAETNERIKEYLHCNCNCTQAAKEFKLKNSAMQVYITRKSELLEKEIGSDTIDTVINADTIEQVDEALKQLRFSVSRKIKPDLFVKEIMDILPEAKYSPKISIDDCNGELSLLRNLTREGLKKLLGQFSEENLAHIKAILAGDSIFDEQVRDEVYKRLLGED